MIPPPRTTTSAVAGAGYGSSRPRQRRPGRCRPRRAGPWRPRVRAGSPSPRWSPGWSRPRHPASTKAVMTLGDPGGGSGLVDHDDPVIVGRLGTQFSRRWGPPSAGRGHRPRRCRGGPGPPGHPDPVAEGDGQAVAPRLARSDPDLPDPGRRSGPKTRAGHTARAKPRRRRHTGHGRVERDRLQEHLDGALAARGPGEGPEKPGGLGRACGHPDDEARMSRRTARALSPGKCPPKPRW